MITKIEGFNIRVANHDDAFSWNQYIIGLSDNPCYLFYEWRFLIERMYRAKTLLLLAEDEDKKILGILFSYHVNGRAKTLYTPEFGVVSDSESVVSALITAANQYCTANNLSRSFFTVGNTLLNESFLKEKNNYSFENHWTKCSFILDLSAGNRPLWNNLSSSSRNKIRKAKKSDVKIASGFNYFEQFYALYEECYLKKRLNIKSQSFFNRMIECLGSRLDLFVCLYNDEIVSGSFFLKNNKMVSYLYNASHSDYRNLGLNDLLIYEVAKHYIKQGYSGINLGESVPGSGAYRFKAKQLKCSPKQVHYYSYRNLNTESLYRSRVFFNKVREKMIITLCEKRYIPSCLVKKLLTKRALFGRFM